jgi:DNA polymerase-3 subunit alpha (Gram-positive type)
MSNSTNARFRFEQLMQTAQLPEEMVSEHFRDGTIDEVRCSASNRHWTFFLSKETLIPAQVYRAFCKQIQDHFQPIAQVGFKFRFADQVTDQELVEEFWAMLVQWLQRDHSGVNGWLAKAALEVKGYAIHVGLIDQTWVDVAQKKQLDERISYFFSTYFLRSYKVIFQLNDQGQAELEKFMQQTVQEDRQVVEEHQQAQAYEAPVETTPVDSDAPFVYGYELKDPAVQLHTIQEEQKKVIVHGTVFQIEERELRNGNTLFQFYITDFTDSLPIKVFAKSKEDLRTLRRLANGMWVKVRGKVEFDTFSQPPELKMMASDIQEIMAPKSRMDEAEEKRVEFHLHTVMSTMDAVTSIGDYVATAAKWGHKAIAITDHGNIHAYPDANKAAKKHGIKLIYGVEANVINDATPIAYNVQPIDLGSAEYVVFDIETTGLSVQSHKIIEVAAIRMKDGQLLDRFESFVNPHEKIPENIQRLTNITDDMVADAPELQPVLEQFKAFIGDAILVAHNANFDMGFMKENFKRLGLGSISNPVLDTLEFARMMYPSMKNHRLNTLADKFKVALDNHHRAIDDTIALTHILIALLKDAEARGFTRLDALQATAGKDLSNVRPFHCCIYAQTQLGKKNLFKLISRSHTDFYHRVPRIPRSLLIELREGLLITSGCEKGELFETALNKSMDEAEQIAAFYDIIELQPPIINKHLVDKGFVSSLEVLEQTNQNLYQLAKKLNKPVIATGNVHYLNPRDKINRDITINGITGFSPLKDMEKPDVHLRTTNEMLECFAHLGKDAAYEVVVTNTSQLADQFEEIEVFPKQAFFPIIEGADDEMRTKCYDKARAMYGDTLPETVESRLERELVPITKAGFAALYLISERLVKKSNEDGYLVGSRGSVGSSVVAMMLGISEVNPLPPHYLCTSCKHSEFFLDGSVASGYDLPNKACPTCGTEMVGEGQDIPFETFLGFKGDKVPDIDLNFSGEYQPHAHNYTKVLFGEKNVFRAGTIGTVADKTAFGYVKKYAEERHQNWRNAEVVRLSSGCTGVKRSTGQHPGGIVVVPDYIDVEDVTPVQYPADDTSSEWQTTHFDYHAFDENLLKLDILGHDDPTMMRMLQDLTGVDPLTIPMNDPKVMSLFNSTEALGVTKDQIRSSVGTYGVPEMGTKFVRQMLEETQPSTFSDLLQISGLSHGTGVWIGNAAELIKNGTCTIKTVIGCRDDIMLYLIYKAGLEAGLAFQITESVRKGKGLKDEWIDIMKEHKVPKWYIDSCLKIEYMFPKAHASAYVISAVRTAYFKLYHPIAYYSAYFTVRAADFDVEVFSGGYNMIKRRLEEIEAKGFAAVQKEKAMIPILEMGLEMTARGFTFKLVDIYRSHANHFVIDGDSLIPPFSAIQGIGENAAKNLAAAREDGEFLSVEDFQLRTRASKTVIELLTQFGCFRNLPESNQLSLF